MSSTGIGKKLPRKAPVPEKFEIRLKKLIGDNTKKNSQTWSHNIVEIIKTLYELPGFYIEFT